MIELIRAKIGRQSTNGRAMRTPLVAGLLWGFCASYVCGLRMNYGTIFTIASIGLAVFVLGRTAQHRS